MTQQGAREAMTIRERLMPLIAQVAGHVVAAEATAESNFVDDLAFDSLDRLELAVRVEEEFEIEITDDEAERAVFVHQLEALIALKLQAKPAPVEYPEMDTFNPYGSGPEPVGPREDVA